LKVKRPALPISLVLAFSLFLTSLPVSAGAARAVTAATPEVAVKQAQTPAKSVDQDSASAQTNNEKFVFSKVDEDLLSEIKLLDERFEKDGAVYHDPGLDNYLTRVGTAVAADKKLENVEWKFRALRDPVLMPSRFRTAPSTSTPVFWRYWKMRTSWPRYWPTKSRMFPSGIHIYVTAAYERKCWR